jgi:hypothetical protein
VFADSHRFEEYRKSLIDHVAEVKIQHWDKSIRELSARAISCLTVVDPKYVHDFVLPKLVASTTASDLNLRHGSILAGLNNKLQ